MLTCVCLGRNIRNIVCLGRNIIKEAPLSDVEVSSPIPCPTYPNEITNPTPTDCQAISVLEMRFSAAGAKTAAPIVILTAE